LHLGCRTTNIVESDHGHLKRYLRSSVGDLLSCWDEIDKMLGWNEHNSIICDTPTPEKPKQDFEVMDEDVDYAISLV